MLILALLACSGSPAPSPAPLQPAQPAPAVVEPAPLPAAPEGAPAGVIGGVIGGEPILPQVIVLGAIATADVVGAVSMHHSAINACFTARAAAQPDLAGKVLIKFSIGKDGKVLESSTASTSLRDEPTETCVNERVREVRFPALADGDKAIVRYPFTFPAP